MAASFEAFCASIVCPNLHEAVLPYVLRAQELLIEGVVVECGVFSGNSINTIARALPTRQVWGFDSFEGLPEDWGRPDMTFAKGAFSTSGTLPAVQDNVRLVKGWFDKALPAWVAANADQTVALLHIDCDIYASTACALTMLASLVRPGTVIVFDELFNYPTFEQHELRALYEFVSAFGWGLQWLGKCGAIDWHPTGGGHAVYEAAAVRIVPRAAAASMAVLPLAATPPLPTPRVAFITAIYGGYESTCKPYAQQSIPCDFIAFTNHAAVQPNGWIVDTTPYHLTHRPAFHQPDMHNGSNTHTFCTAKYYKQSFHNIPRLAGYEVVVWLDGTVQITNPHTAEIVLQRMSEGNQVVTWQHERRPCGEHALAQEVEVSMRDYRYTSTFWFGQPQPVQDCNAQYAAYLKDGYDWTVFPKGIHVWVTCFVGFNMRWSGVTQFLDLWYRQTLAYTTQDQVGFPYVCWKLRVFPYTFPDAEVPGHGHSVTALYTKLVHGR